MLALVALGEEEESLELAAVLPCDALCHVMT
jgi:hypothetical protein